MNALLRGLAALTLVLVGLGAGTATASAAAPAALPDPVRSASLTIVATGTAGSAAGGPVAGAGYTIKRVGPVDFGTAAGWVAATSLSAGIDTSSNVTAESSLAATSGTTLAPVGTGLTGPDGSLRFAGLAVGLYLVEPTSMPAGALLPPPFLVTLPTTAPGGGGWVYDLVVHPKSAVTSITKTVTDHSSTGPGSTVAWTVTASIPRPPAPGQQITGYAITDRLDRRLTYLAATVAVRDVVTGVVTAVPADAYVLARPSAANRRSLHVTFTSPGLALLTAHAGQQVQVILTTRVTGTGAISNTATLYSQLGDDGSVSRCAALRSDPRTGVLKAAAVEPGCVSVVVSAPVETRWGAVRVLKTNPEHRPLAGARFAVYLTRDDARARRDPIALSAPTDASGRTTITGLRVSDHADDRLVSSGQTGYVAYWLAETVPPPGYRILAQPIAFTVSSDDRSYTAMVTVTDLPASLIPPDEATGPDSGHGGGLLPNTGASVSLAMVALAVGLVIAGGAAIALSRRRSAEESAEE
ncbi:MAG: SpaH/EbpB family LPXTG-anchored major pilin [Actinomycetia bacterium]|nr:SpaH/EbpB family LPXTG-anchored major pilin [Actinomycetes bacterium]